MILNRIISSEVPPLVDDIGSYRNMRKRTTSLRSGIIFAISYLLPSGRLTRAQKYSNVVENRIFCRIQAKTPEACHMPLQKSDRVYLV